MTSIFLFHNSFKTFKAHKRQQRTKAEEKKHSNWNKLKGREINLLASLAFFVTFGGLSKAIFICLLRLRQTLCSAPFVQLSISANPLWMLTTARAFCLHRQYLTLSVKDTEAIRRPESITLFNRQVHLQAARRRFCTMQKKVTHPFVLQPFPSLFSFRLPGRSWLNLRNYLVDFHLEHIYIPQVISHALSRPHYNQKGFQLR